MMRPSAIPTVLRLMMIVLMTTWFIKVDGYRFNFAQLSKLYSTKKQRNCPTRVPLKAGTQVDYHNSIQKIYQELDHQLGLLVTKFAVETVGYYMQEFQDDISHTWMISYRDYQTKGFGESEDWKGFLSSMIDLEKQEIEVFLQPPRHPSFNSQSSRNTKNNSNLRIRYKHELEPRQIAHRIVTVREHVSNELQTDLLSMYLEHQEAMRFAQEWKTRSKEFAETHRGVTRMEDPEGETPYRKKNFFDCSVLITNLALDITRAELRSEGESAIVSWLEGMVSKVELEEDNQGSSLEKLIYKLSGPRNLLEELCYEGLNSPSDSTQLRVAHRVMETRWALAQESTKYLSSQSGQCRDFYRQIKEKGGFQTFSTRGRHRPSASAAPAPVKSPHQRKPIVDLVDISKLATTDDEGRIKAEASAAEAQRLKMIEEEERARQQELEQEAAAAALELLTQEVENEEEFKQFKASEDEDAGLFGPGNIGPLLM